MKTINELWGNRLSDYIKELAKYLKYMLNDHLLFVLLIAMGWGAFSYSNWVKTIDSSFPGVILIAMVLSFFLSWSPIYTLLKNADRVYLLPIEIKMKTYFKKSITLSFFVQSVILFFITAASMPLYVQVSNEVFSRFFSILIVVLFLKMLNIWHRWHILKFQEKEVRLIDNCVRFLLNGSFLYLFLQSHQLILTVAIGIILVAYCFYFNAQSKDKGLKWDLLIQLEEQRMLAFYRIANLFTDVPKMKGQVKRRKWADRLLPKPHFNKEQTYSYLYGRTFIRMNEYFGLYTRLTIIGMILIAYTDQLIVRVLIGLLFIYLTGIQLLPLLKKHEQKVWPFLYPVSKTKRASSFIKLLQIWLLSQVFLFGLAGLMSGFTLFVLYMWGVGLVFTFLFVNMYATSRIRKMGFHFTVRK
jgi:ABC-2 type transport system permease protein